MDYSTNMPMHLVQPQDAYNYSHSGSLVGRDVGKQHLGLWQQHFDGMRAREQAANQQQQLMNQRAMQQQDEAMRRQAEQHREAMEASRREQERKSMREQTIAGLAGSMGGFRRTTAGSAQGMGGSSAFRKSLLD